MTQKLRIIRVDEPDLTKSEARELTTKLKEQVEGVGATLFVLYSRNGWRALGYESFVDYRDKEFADMGKSYFYRLLNASKVSDVIGVPVQERQARILDELPKEKLAEAWEKAETLAGAEKVTMEHVRAAVDEVKETVPAEDHNPPKPVAGRVVPATPDEATVGHESRHDRLDHALATLREACGPKLDKAIEAKSFEHLKDADVILWAQEEVSKGHKPKNRTAEEIQRIERLVTGADRCTVRQALQILSDMPTDKTRLAQMQNLAIAEGGATLAVVGGATHVALAPDLPKWAAKEIAALVKKIQDR